MPLIQSQIDNLPYIDPAPSDEALAAANAVIQQELSPEAATALHTDDSQGPLRAAEVLGCS